MRILGFLDGGFWGTSALPVGASCLAGHYWCRSSHGPPLSGSFFGLFWLFAGFGSFGLLGWLPLSLPFCPPWLSCLGLAGLLFFWPLCLSWPFALLSWAVRSGTALRWPFLPWPFGLCVGLPFCPFVLRCAVWRGRLVGFLFVLL